MIRVVLVDDHVVVRSGFAQLLTLEPDLAVAGQFSSAAEAWQPLLRDDVSVAVLDIAMPDENGLSLLKRLRAKRPGFRAIILSIYDTPAFVKSALDAGASGYLTKRCGPEELVQAVRSVSMGGTTCAPMRCGRCAAANRRPRRSKYSPRANARSLRCW